MRGIVQYEVYVLDQGRWSLHARYPSAQRQAAIIDASATESDTGHPTKVVRDTYWAEDNRNEEVTTYLSPKARALQALRSSRRMLQASILPAAGSTYGRPGPAVTAPNRRQVARTSALMRTIRLIVAIGMSLFFASGLTAALSTIMTRLEHTYPVDDGTKTMVLAIVYLLIFTYVFRRTIRAKMRIHQIIFDMWENTEKPAANYPPRRAMGRTYRASPPRQPWQMPQERRPRTDAEKTAPGAPPAEEAKAAPAVAPAPPPPAPPPPALDDPAKAATPPAPPAAATAPKPAPEPAKAVGIETAPPKSARDDADANEESPVAFIPPAVLDIPEGLALERIILRRFAVDVVIPAVARAYRDDPVTRRGIALLIAGAVQGLAQTNPVTQVGAMALLAEALRESGSKAAVIESFLGNYETNLKAPNTQALLAAGRQAIKGYVDGVQGVDRDIQQALLFWRFPSSARVVAAPAEFYLFSIAREESLTDGEPTTGLLLHQAIVRAAVQEFSGTLVPHDAAGILARFDTVHAVVDAARAIQTRVLAAAGPGTATVVVEGPLSAPGVAEDTASVLERARALLSVTVDGEVVCDAGAHRSLGESVLFAEPLNEGANAVRLVASTPGAPVT